MCKGEHVASSRECPAYKRALENKNKQNPKKSSKAKSQSRSNVQQANNVAHGNKQTYAGAVALQSTPKNHKQNIAEPSRNDDLWLIVKQQQSNFKEMMQQLTNMSNNFMQLVAPMAQVMTNVISNTHINKQTTNNNVS